VVLLDLAMPRMDGFAFAGLFHELPDCGSVPLIALSGYSSQTYRARAWEVGIRHYLLKPADPEILRDLLDQEIIATAALTSLSADTVSRLALEFGRPKRRILHGLTPQMYSAPMTVTVGS